jgi:hypothetical protein
MHWHWHRRRPHHHVRPVLLIRGLAIELEPSEKLIMASTITVGGKGETLSIEYIDANGTVISPSPAPDSPPVWTNSDNTVATDAVSADGNTNVVTGFKAGTDAVGLSLVIGGVTFIATEEITVTDAVASVRIVATPNP